MLFAPVDHCEDEELKVTAPRALGTKFQSAIRGNPNTGRALHQTKIAGLRRKLKSKVKTQKHNSMPGPSAFGGAVQWH